MLPVLYNNNYQIVQTPDTVMILVEMVHDVRVIRINGTHNPPASAQWLGDSIGHWEGDTLVVDTTNFTDQTRFRGSSENLHVIERFKRVDANTILYAPPSTIRHVHQAVDDGVSVSRHRRPGLRIRLPRRQLRHAGHSGRRAQAGDGRKEVAGFQASLASR